MASSFKFEDVSLTQVAQAANVSLGTASRVMNGDASVNAQLRRRVMTSRRKLGFVPKLRRRQIAVVTGRPSPGLPIGYTSVVSAMIMKAAVARRFGVELFDVDSLDEIAGQYIDAVIGVVFDGRITELLDQPNLPVVTINHPMVEQGVHSVYSDHFEHGHIATEHLIERGHKRIAFLAVEPNEWGSQERKRGYERAMEDAGLTVDPALVHYTTQAPVYDILCRWVRNDVSAILNFSEDTAAEALHILSNVLKLRIGQEISTITSEELPVYQYFTPPQTTIRQPLKQMVDRAVQHVADLFNPEFSTGDGDNQDILDCCYKAKLIVRDSVADLRAN